MANQEQLDILKQGVEVWNKWRSENETAKINLSSAKLSETNFSRGNFSNAFLFDVNFRDAKLGGAIFSRAHLNNTNLSDASLVDANFSESHLNETNFSRAYLTGANFKGAEMGGTIFADADLSKTSGLESVIHNYPSIISTSTIQSSEGKIPESFLRGCGLSDIEIEFAKIFNPSLTNEEITKIQYRIYDLRATQAIQISPLFISYSHTDSTFVDILEKELNEKGVRFWRDIHDDMTAGRMETQIDRAIRQNPTVLLILSKNSMNSDWVQHEVRKARELEKELRRDALCPIALDDSWKSSRWPQRIMEQVMEYNILDFSKWEDEGTFNVKFAKLLSGLEIFYKKPEK